MTIFRSKLIDVERLTYQFVSANDPDIIGIEVALNGNVLIDVSMDAAGQTSVLFDDGGGHKEFDLAGLRRVLDKCEGELEVSRQSLIKPGEIWSESQ